MRPVTKHILSPDGDDQFQFRLNKEEGVGLLTTTSKKNYFILDSAEYWYDVIQKKIPPKLKCQCKNDWFTVRFDYVIREDTEDVEVVHIVTECTICFTEKKRATIAIDYSPTDELINNPVTYCEQPLIKYDLKEILCYWTMADLKKFLSFLSKDMEADIYCWYWQHKDDKKYIGKVSLEKAQEIISVNHRYFSFYFSGTTTDIEVITDDDGSYVKGEPWRRQELVGLPAPMVIDFGKGAKALLFYIYFCTQYIDQGRVVDKSAAFRSFTGAIMKWLKENYLDARGKDNFDNPEEHIRIFGDKFLKKRKKIGKP